MRQQPSQSRPTRRQLLAAVPLTLLAACRRSPYNKADFVVAPQSTMALLPAASYSIDISNIISRGLDLLGLSVRGRRVLLKPNLVEYEAGMMINTNSMVIAAAIDALRRAGAGEVVVAEGPGHRRDTEYLLAASGLANLLQELRAPFVDLNLDDVRPTKLRSRFSGLEELSLPVEVLRSDFVVSMAKLKTHHWAGMTASMKNLFGVVPGAVYGWPKNFLHAHGIEECIIDLTATIRPAFTIVDAVVSMEGDGPIMGQPRNTGFLAMGTDLVAVDSTCARIIGLDPRKIGYLRVASQFLGNSEPGQIRQHGEPPTRFATTFDIVEPLRSLRLEGR
ncbi:MAG: hypothetical protein H6Q33_1447 [Deltaproteobacteria bacterium]|nr:hypothetical protein [Deltaproteobacteria bacterium]